MSLNASAQDSTLTTGTKLSTTNATGCFTNPQQQPAKLIDASICNTSASAVDITVAFYDASATTAYARYSGYSLAAKTTLILGEGTMTFAKDDELRVTAGTINTIEVLVNTASTGG